MKKNYLIILSIVFTVLFLDGCVSYRSAKSYGDKQFNLGRYYTAAVAYEKSYNSKPTYEKSQKIAKTYTVLKDYDNAKKWWETVVSYNSASSDDYKNYVTAIYQSGSSGSYNIDSIISISSLNADQFSDLKRTVGLIKNNPKIKLVQEERFNQNNSAEAGIFVDAKERYFISTNGANKSKSVKVNKVRLDRSVKYSKEYLDFNNNPYFKIMIPNTSGSWTDLKLDLKNIQQLGSLALNEKDQMAFVTVFRNLDNFEKRNISLNSELYYGKLDNGYRINNPKPFPLNSAFEYSIQTPFVDEQNKLLYFSSDMPGGNGGFDLYVVAYNDNYDFSTPVNLGSSINSSGNESFPFVKDNVLYFSSDGHVGLGGLDIFSSTIVGNSYSAPENMGRPYNSRVDDFSYIISSKDDQYLISNRGVKYGIDQIYKVINSGLAVEINLGSDFTQADLANLKVYNSKGEEIKDFEVDGNILRFSASEPGDYMVLKKGSLPEVFNVTEEQFKNGKEARFNANFRPVSSLIVFEDIIYFNFDRFDIRSSDFVVLDRLKDYLNRYSFLNLSISAHTDSKASDEYNIQLSEKRARAVGNYFGSKGIIATSGMSSNPDNFGSGTQDVKEMNGLFYTVQILAGGMESLTKFRNDNSVTNFERINNNLVRVSKGRFATANEAINYSRKMISEGYTDAFPVAYLNGERYNLKEINKLIKKDNVPSYSNTNNSKGGSQNSINNSRITMSWFGKKLPFVDCVDCDEELHQLNRRAELKLLLNQDFDLNQLPIQDLIIGSTNEESLKKTIRRNVFGIQD